MAILTLKKIPNGCLRIKARRIDKVGPIEKQALADMVETMYIYGGIGLAATQVGINMQLAVIDVGQGPLKFINPSIVKKEGCEIQEEGCLSVPDATIKVRRAKKVTVSYLTEDGFAMKITADGIFARAIQHEIDHLAGKLIVDYVNPIKRLMLMRKGKRAHKKINRKNNSVSSL